MNNTIFIFIAILFSILAILLLTFKLWLPKIRPDLFFYFNIFEDESLLKYYTKKIFIPLEGNKNIYTFNKCLYKKKGFLPYINNIGVYEWNFIEGFEDPILFNEDVSKKVDGKLLFEAKKETLDDIWASNDPFIEFIEQNWRIILVALFVIMTIGFFVSRAKTGQVPITG